MGNIDECAVRTQNRAMVNSNREGFLPSTLRFLTLLTVASALAMIAVGCGDGGSSTTDTETGESGSPLSVPPPQNEAEREAESKAPEGASAVLRAIYRQFPAPQPNPKVKGSAGAIAAGEKACAGKTPLEAREEFLPRSDLSGFQREQVERIPDYEKSPSYSFPAGQLAASVYEKTLPPTEVAPYGFQGCVYALSRVLKARLAPK
jgi:hypothetical protein